MNPHLHPGQILIAVGFLLIVIGITLLIGGRIPFFGRLPGDLSFHGRNWSAHVPVVTSIVISLILTLILNFFSRR